MSSVSTAIATLPLLSAPRLRGGAVSEIRRLGSCWIAAWVRRRPSKMPQRASSPITSQSSLAQR
eukprot:2711965-Pyramimonas_sp.AAC.1